MENVKVEVKGNELILTVDLSKEVGPSKTGKTIIIGTSSGNEKVPGNSEIQFGLNVFKKPK